jgi:ubiquitin-conjugating enzyme E2 D
MSAKKLQRELKMLAENGSSGYCVSLVDDNIFHWNAAISGPENTPYEDGVFSLDIQYPVEYPFKPPTVQFQQRVYHCNISRDGKICLEILQEWSPATSTEKILDAVWQILKEPNPDSPVQADIAVLYRENRNEYNKKAREFTMMYAT